MPRKRRGRRRRNARTQRPVSVTVHRTGTGRATELTTYTWASAPTAWDDAAAQMVAQVRKAERATDKRQKKARRARRESVKEARAEGWRARYRKPSASPFDALPGMADRTGATITRRQPTIPATERQRGGMASKGPASTLDHATATRILSLKAEDWTTAAIAKELGIPRTTLSKWLSTGRAQKVAAAVGEGLT